MGDNGLIWFTDEGLEKHGELGCEAFHAGLFEEVRIIGEGAQETLGHGDHSELEIELGNEEATTWGLILIGIGDFGMLVLIDGEYGLEEGCLTRVTLGLDAVNHLLERDVLVGIGV